MNGIPKFLRAEQLVVYKGQRRLELWAHGQLIKSYKVALGRKAKYGPKMQQGDCRTPEGEYQITSKDLYSNAHLNLGISYPNEEDMRRAGQLNLEPGSSIKIHGLPPKISFLGRLHRFVNWTSGCIAVSNREMEELFLRVDIGTKVVILPQ